MKKTILILLAAIMPAIVTTASQTTKLWPKTEGVTTTFNGWDIQEGDEPIILDPQDLQSAAVGDRLVVSFSIIDTNSWSAINIWDASTENNYFDSGSVAGSTRLSITIDETLAAAIADTLKITGCNVVVSQVDWETGEVPDAEGKVWPTDDGTTVSLGNWSGSLPLTADYLQGLSAGDTVCAKVSPIAGSEGYVVELWDLKITKNYFVCELTETDTEANFVMTDESAKNLAAGLAFTGTGEVITEVWIKKKSDNPGTDLSDGAIWPEKSGLQTTFTGWEKTSGDDIIIDGSKFANAQAGDKLVFKIQPVGSADDYHEIDIYDTKWENTLCDPIEFAADATTIEMELTADVIERLKQGCVVTGCNVLITEIDLISPTGIATVETETRSAESCYDLSGRRFHKDGAQRRGIYIVNGKKRLLGR